jgi:uncharacterized repeat protein (TIGR03803 family)
MAKSALLPEARDTPARAYRLVLLLVLQCLLAACGGGGGSSGPPTPNSLSISPSDSLVVIGKTLQLTATGHYIDGSTRDLSTAASWSSSQMQTATVAGGLVTAIAPGSTTITATYNGVPNSITVTVVEALSYLYTFQKVPTDAGQPNGPLLQASDGNFYGTTRAGGSNLCRPPDNIPCGAIFKVTPAGVETVLYSFGASATDAYTPLGPLIQGTDGALYGTTASGGTTGAGTVFKMTLDGTYTVLYSFGATPTDGIVPASGLMQASDGNFYGTTSSGGTNSCFNIPQNGANCGTVFRLTPAGVETVLYSFGASVSDGVEPNGPLIQASDGNLYGTTTNGGANACSTSGETHDCGTLFKITLAGVESVLYSFGTSLADGIAPQGPLVQGSDGALYGTTASGGGGTCGGSYGCGTVFRLDSSGMVSVIYAFALTSRSNGYGPSPFLIQASDGDFYGSTTSGGAFGGDLEGTLFKLTPSGQITTLYSFGPLNMNPSDPYSGVIQGSDGAFYGVTAYSGQGGGSGTVFKLVAP